MKGFCIALLTTLVACAMAAAAPYDDPNGNTHVVCLHDSTQTYELYIPPTAPATQRPILYAFDPGGNGKAVLRAMAAPALENGWIVAASNNSQNGPWQTIFDAQDAIIQDTEARWNVHPTHRFAAGFSGGARASLALAFRFPDKVCGVLCMGAGWPVNTELMPSTDTLIVRIIIGGLDSNYCYDIPETQGQLVDASIWCEVDTIPYMDHVFPPAANVTSATRWLNENAQTDRNAGYTPAECLPGSVYCQQPNGPLEAWTAFYSDGWDWTFYEDFQGVQGPISRVEWWGIAGKYKLGYWIPAEAFDLFTVKFYEDNGGVPGAVLREEYVFAEMTELPGFYNNNYPLMHYAAPLLEPLEMSSGWISIESFADFLWLSSPTGNGRMMVYDYTEESTAEYDYDLAVNLAVQPVVVEFEVDDAWGQYPHTVEFCGTAEYLLGEDATWLWDFGDGNTSTDWPCATHTYTEPGAYTVTLTVATSSRTGSMTREEFIVAAETLPAGDQVALAGLAALLAGIGAAAARRARAV